jgi:hypothetical protein
MRVFIRVDGRNEFSENVCVCVHLLTVRHDIHGDIVLFQLFCETDEDITALALRNGRVDEEDDALALILVLSVFEGEMCDGERGG